MTWNPKHAISKNELGEYLPDGEAQLQEGYEFVEAKNQKDADLKCEEIAAEYGGTDATAHPTDKADEYDCRFKFWS